MYNRSFYKTTFQRKVDQKDSSRFYFTETRTLNDWMHAMRDNIFLKEGVTGCVTK